MPRFQHAQIPIAQEQESPSELMALWNFWTKICNINDQKCPNRHSVNFGIKTLNKYVLGRAGAVQELLLFATNSDFVTVSKLSIEYLGK